MDRYNIIHKNVENETVNIQMDDLTSVDVGHTVNVNLTASDAPNLAPVIIQSLNSDEDKTTPIKSKQLKIGFNSGTYNKDGVDTVINVKTFSDGPDDRFLVKLIKIAGADVAAPFVGNISFDDNSEAYQPRPNPVLLSATDGLNSLKTVELKEDDGETLPIGHYRIIDFIYFCLRVITPASMDVIIHVIMNLYEESTDPTTSHAFKDTYLDALTFEKEIDSREDCFTVLTKILDAFGCFICFEEERWLIIRWDEFDSVDAAVTNQRVARYNGPNFSSYTTSDLRRIIASDQDVLYDGHFLSMDSAKIRFQRKANKVKHTYNYTQPSEIPCNVGFTRGIPDDTVLPLLTFIPECWTLLKGVPGSYTGPGSTVRSAERYDTDGVLTERFVFLTPEPTHSSSSTSQTYIESQPIYMKTGDKFNCSVQWRLESDADFGSNYNLIRFMLTGDDGSFWLLGGESPTGDSTTKLRWWNTSIFTVNTAAGGIDIDFTLIEETEWQDLSFEAPPIPVDGKLYIWLNQINQTNVSEDNQVIDYTALKFEYLPYLNGTYREKKGQEQTVEADNGSRLVIEKEMFISDAPRQLFKGALKKSLGGDFGLTGKWNDFFSPIGSMQDVPMSKFTLFAWWNQFRKTRTVIETDIQGLRQNDEGCPSLINRWKINHDEEAEKHFMLTSFRDMNFRTASFTGVFVETSDDDLDRDYNDDYNLKIINS